MLSERSVVVNYLLTSSLGAQWLLQHDLTSDICHVHPQTHSHQIIQLVALYGVHVGWEHIESQTGAEDVQDPMEEEISVISLLEQK